MTRRRRPIPLRKRYFFGCEGSTEVALVTWLQNRTDIQGHHYHLDPVSCGGGDTYNIVKTAVDKRRRGRNRGPYVAEFVLLDHDRLVSDIRNGRDPRPLANQENFSLIFSKPTIEGLFLRLHPGCENRFPPPNTTLQALKTVWPEYEKPPIAEDLSRFTTNDLRRAAAYDSDLRNLLTRLGLI